MLIENTSKLENINLAKRECTNCLGKGYKGNYSSFTYLVRNIEELGILNQEAFLKNLPSKGTLQVDFDEMIVMDKRVLKKVMVFCANFSIASWIHKNISKAVN